MKQDLSSLAIIGGGPAGLMAAELCAGAGLSVTLYDRMPNMGRKFLMAGRGGLNLTHSEALDHFIARYENSAGRLQKCIHAFPPDALRAWCEGLGEETFIGSSGRVFPKTFKASPLLRAWLQRLTSLGVTFKTRHEWKGWDEAGCLLFETADKSVHAVKPSAALLALGGASWPRLGADGGWVSMLNDIKVSPLRPANCGFAVNWTPHFVKQFEGQPLKTLMVSFDKHSAQGDMMITQHGIEGGVVYALSSKLRDAITAHGNAILHVDLRKDLTADDLINRLNAGRGSQSLSTFLKKVLNLSPAAIGLIHEANRAHNIPIETAAQLAQLIKHLPITLTAPFGLERAISTAGGIALDEINDHFMLHKKPGVFVAGEMLDWEAPTGGYLLQACMSTAFAAAQGIIGYCNNPQKNGGD
jgi:uncharacterized flavoprotein (TIGR03862 family)